VTCPTIRWQIGHVGHDRVNSTCTQRNFAKFVRLKFPFMVNSVVIFPTNRYIPRCSLLCDKCRLHTHISSFTALPHLLLGQLCLNGCCQSSIFWCNVWIYASNYLRHKVRKRREPSSWKWGKEKKLVCCKMTNKGGKWTRRRNGCAKLDRGRWESREFQCACPVGVIKWSNFRF
jgi:hypothetical protein